MDADRTLAVVSVGGVVTLVVGAVLARLLDWPTPAGGASPSLLGVAAVAALLVGLVAAAVVWGRRGTDSPARNYW